MNCFLNQVKQLLLESNPLLCDKNNPPKVVFPRCSESELAGWVYNILVRLLFWQWCNISDNLIYVPQPRKLVFPLQLRVKQCCIFHYRGIQCRNWTAHAHYSLTAERNLFLILLLLTYSSYSGTQFISYSSSSHFFFVQR